jgi:hypothetical protein
MNTYIEINGLRYPALITGRISDKDWDGRETKTIDLEMTYAEVLENFVDGVSWNIIHIEEDREEIYDNSDFCISGPITDSRNGTVSIKMGKYTNEELLLMEVLG